MNTHRSFKIEVLDNGFVLKTLDKKTAIESKHIIKQLIVEEFRKALDGLGQPGNENVEISFDVNENVKPIQYSRSA